ncbi:MULTISPECIES: PilN domain-containing protein [unclassified Yoonia]|uniref:PilN domain-containing protein n=1 Tax=unclassified Yoonia TaxID=2629118 RepID=UPI002AFEE1F4|nr:MULTISPECIES: PilN domain-containing protein [unclassified Yoonia]
MSVGTLSELTGKISDALYESVPSWLRVAFFAEPVARLLYIGETPPEGAMAKPESVLTTRGQVRGHKVVDVLVPTALLLARTIRMPATSKINRKALAELDLLRRTPFALDEVYWTLGANTDRNADTYTQWVAKRSDIVSFRSALATHGFRVRRFLIAGHPSASVLADFTADIAPHAKLQRRINYGAAGVIVLALLSVWLQPAWQARTEMARQTEAVTALFEEAVALRSEIEALKRVDDERTQFVNSFIRRDRVVDALRQLSVALPDHVWASDMSIASGEITLSGETSQSAADLVLALTEANLSYVPALTGPVSRTAEGKERFGLVFRPQEVRQ